AATIKRGDQGASDLGGLFQNGVGGVGIHRLSKDWQARPQAGSLEDVMQNKAQIAQRGSVLGHRQDLAQMPRRARRVLKKARRSGPEGQSASAWPLTGVLAVVNLSRCVRSTRMYSAAPAARPQPAPYTARTTPMVPATPRSVLLLSCSKPTIRQ